MQVFTISCISIGILLPVLFASSGSCVQCWKCENVTSFSECTASGELKECGNKEACFTEVRRDQTDTKIWKGCKQSEACENQRSQNWERNPHTCNNDQNHSHCWCCCDNDSCNQNETCEVVLTQCPMPSLHLDHGEVTCSNSNHLGSLCTYRCTEEDYHGLPLKKLNRLCLGNGKWSEKKPCCVQPCPPFVPLDLVGLAHYKSNDSLNKRFTGLGPLFRRLKFGKEFFQNFVVYFNEEVYHVYLPGDPEVVGTFRPSANNTANTGAALRYVRDNILSHLHRRGRHSDVVLVSVEKESDDDVTEVAAELKRNGATIIYAFYQSTEHKVNMEEARAIATSEDHILVVGGEKEVNFVKLFSDIFALACNYPCPDTDEE